MHAWGQCRSTNSMRMYVQVKSRGYRANECISLKHTQTASASFSHYWTHTYAFVSGLSFLHVSAVWKWLWEMNSDMIVMERERRNMGWWRDDRCVNYLRDGGNDAVMPPSVSVCLPSRGTNTPLGVWGGADVPWLACYAFGGPASVLSCEVTGSVATRPICICMRESWVGVSPIVSCPCPKPRPLLKQ